MGAARYDFAGNQAAEQNATFDRLLTYRDSTGALVNLTGATGSMYVRDSYGAAAAVLQLTTDNDRMIFGGAAGTIRLLVAKADMAAIVVPDAPRVPPARECVYDLKVVIAGETRLLYGTFEITRGVTP